MEISFIQTKSHQCHYNQPEVQTGERNMPKLEEANKRNFRCSNITPERAESAQLAFDETSNTKGVVRNLMQDHYRRVADIRLRINFFDDLKTLHNSDVEEGLERFFGSIKEKVGAIPTFGEIDTLDQYYNDFEQTVKNAADRFMDSSLASENELIDLVTKAFNEFIETLHWNFSGENIPALDDTDDQVENIETKITNTDELINELKNKLMSELDLLIDTLRRTDNSPNDFVDLRKGANAYSKFAEIYRQMSQSDTLNASDSNNSLEEAV